MPPTKEQLEYASAFREPNAFYVTGEDNLRIASLNSVAGVQVTISGRMLTLDGKLQPFSVPHVPNTDRTVRTQIHILGEGWIQNLSAVVTAGAPLYGQTWIRAEIVRGSTGAVEPLAVLLQGNVTAVQKIAFPGAQLYATQERPGAIRLVSGTDPNVGSEITETVPTGARWRVLGFRASLVTDATAANRAVTLLCVDVGGNVFEHRAAAVQAASLTGNYSATAAGYGTTIASNTIMIPIAPNIVLLAGAQIKTFTSSLQVGDDWTAPKILVEEWLEGN